MVSLREGNIFRSVHDQKPQPYWTFDDPYPQYIQVQRTLGSINGTSVSFNVNAFDPNAFMRSKAVIKLGVSIQKQERNPANGAINASNYVIEDRIYKKPGMVLTNSCTHATIRINSHTIVYDDLRYIQKKLNMSFAGKKINNNYFSTSGSLYENYDGTYDEFGDIAALGDSGRQLSYDDAFKDITVGQTDNTFNFTEPLSIGPFNHLSDYSSSEIYDKSWSLKQSSLIPYIRELGLDMNFSNISANSLIYAYGRNNNAGNNRECQLVDLNIVSAQLILYWVKPRDELLINMPRTVRIQSWLYNHQQFDLPDTVAATDIVVNGATAINSQDNIYTNQVPSYILYYGMVNKDIVTSYICRAVNTDSDGGGADPVLSLNTNSVESGMHPSINGIGSNINIRSNTLGGDDIFDNNYNLSELYRITLKNSYSDFPYNESRFRGLQVAESLFSTYPSEFYFLMGESDLNSFFIRKGQLQTSNVMNFSSTLTAIDGYSISSDVQGGAFDGGDKQYALHVVFIYDRYYIELSDDGIVNSDFDSKFF